MNTSLDEEMKARIFEAIRKRNDEQVIELCNEWETTNPDSLTLLTWRANAFHRLGRDVEAVENYSKVIDLYETNAYDQGSVDPGIIMLLIWHAHALQRLERYEEAVGDYTRLIHLFETSEEAKHRPPRELADIYRRRGVSLRKVNREQEGLTDLARSLADLTKDTEESPDDWHVFYERAWVYDALGDIQRAVLDFRHALTGDIYETVQSQMLDYILAAGYLDQSVGYSGNVYAQANGEIVNYHYLSEVNTLERGTILAGLLKYGDHVQLSYGTYHLLEKPPSAE